MIHTAHYQLLGITHNDKSDTVTYVHNRTGSYRNVEIELKFIVLNASSKPDPAFVFEMSFEVAKLK